MSLFEWFMIFVWGASAINLVAMPFMFIRQHRLKQQLLLQNETIESLKVIVANGDQELFQQATKQLASPQETDVMKVVTKEVSGEEAVRLAEIELKREAIRAESERQRIFWENNGKRRK